MTYSLFKPQSRHIIREQDRWPLHENRIELGAHLNISLRIIIVSRLDEPWVCERFLIKATEKLMLKHIGPLGALVSCEIRFLQIRVEIRFGHFLDQLLNQVWIKQTCCINEWLASIFNLKQIIDRCHFCERVECYGLNLIATNCTILLLPNLFLRQTCSHEEVREYQQRGFRGENFLRISIEEFEEEVRFLGSDRIVIKP